MPYGQFWDVRVTYGGAYDFDAANVDQMTHQLTKSPTVKSIDGMEALLLDGGLVQEGGGADGWDPQGRARRRWRGPSTPMGHTAALTALA